MELVTDEVLFFIYSYWLKLCLVLGLPLELSCTIFWVVAPLLWQKFTGSVHLCLAYFSTLKKEKIRFFETSGNVCRTTLLYTPEHSVLHSNRCENLKVNFPPFICFSRLHWFVLYSKFQPECCIPRLPGEISWILQSAWSSSGWRWALDSNVLVCSAKAPEK